VAARERDAHLRAAWWDEVSHEPVERMVFLDETSTNTAMLTRYARAPRGERAAAVAPRNHGPNVTLIATLTVAGPGPALVVEGAVTSEVFVAYVEQVLLPWLAPGALVILDNLSVHTQTRVRSLMEAAGCEVRFLPAYSPDYSPIEAAFAKLKAWLRQIGARTFDELVAAIGQGLDRISAHDAHGCFRGCGYAVERQPL
jgi:transposase